MPYHLLRRNRRLCVKSRPICPLAAFLLAAVAGLAVAAQPVTVDVVQDTGDQIVLQYELGEFSQQPVPIDGQPYTRITLGTESPLTVAAAPELPNVCRSVIIPDDARMAVEATSTEFYEISGIDVVPSKGILSRQVNPDDVPYSFGEAYDTDAFYPGELVSIREPYILRDHRGVVVELNPFQYNPVSRTLRVYTSVTVEVSSIGPGVANVLQRRERALSLEFHKVYTHHFLNYDAGLRYAPLDEEGDMLIICYDSWLSNVQPLVNHRNAVGINTTAVGVSTVGNTVASIKNYIQTAYNTGNLAFVLLVGDAVEVVTPRAAIDNGAADPTYALVSGTDHYPDILVGRFSAQTAGQVDTQVLRTVEYEQMPATTQPWFKKGIGIASAEGAGIGDDGEADYQHMDNIRADLVGYGYNPVDRIYATNGGTAAQVRVAVNSGRGIINYTGHGSATSWGTTGFNNTYVNALVNDNMLPFIISVACVNGKFDTTTCFAEAWLRATNGSEPTGAIGMYASSINQDWQSPMCGQDEVVDLLVSEAYFSFGALCFAGSCQMMDEYGSGAGSSGRNMFDTWHVFGDPSVRVYGEVAPTCEDGLQNQEEERIDCGGPNCPDCDCTADAQCDNSTYCDGTETCDAYGFCQDGAAVNCPDDALFCNGTEFCNEGADSCDHTGDPCVAPEVCDEAADMCLIVSTTIDAAASCLDHDKDEYCLTLDLVGAATCEPRIGGVTRLVLETADTVAADSTSASASCAERAYTGVITVTSDGTATVVVDLDPLPDQDCCTIQFTGGIEDSVTVISLEGDVNGDGNVSTADGSSVKQRLGIVVGASDFRYDPDLDGSVSTADGSFVKQRLGRAAPSCP
ncbi:MAG TPA: C25 family cysteine peptidase [Phycisphaerae bacterium]|nr:C25 family cysteine peptidase [Phycisphaerae bacterium]